MSKYDDAKDLQRYRQAQRRETAALIPLTFELEDKVEASITFQALFRRHAARRRKRQIP